MISTHSFLTSVLKNTALENDRLLLLPRVLEDGKVALNGFPNRIDLMPNLRSINGFGRRFMFRYLGVGESTRLLFPFRKSPETQFPSKGDDGERGGGIGSGIGIGGGGGM
jgi:hypothetical protein